MLRVRRAQYIVGLICAAVFVPIIVGHAFPLNGGLERSWRGTPFGWEKTGAWSFHPLHSYEGGGHFLLNKRFARPGAELLSRSFRLIAPGDTLSLSLAYRSSGCGASAGVVFCDALGQSLDERLECSLPPADEWTAFETEFEMDPASLPEDAAGVRISVLVDAEDIEVRVDAVSLEGPAGNAVDAGPTSSARVTYWQSPDLMGHVRAELAIDEADCDPDGEVQRTAAWLSSPLLVHGTYPHHARATVDLVGDTEARATFFIRGLGADRSEVLWQEIQPVVADADTPVSVELPALFIESQTVYVQTGLMLQSTGPATATLVDCELLPVPLSVELNGVQRKTEFDDPGDVDVFVSAINNVDAELASEAVITVADASGTVVHRESRSIRIAGRSAASFSVKPRLSAPGDYTFRICFRLGAAEIAAKDFEFMVGNGA